ncbi:MAG: leucine-rich repeat domain-containing protein [Lachnospiraceae bacterium]|nr:leucine-rich repeat domain-containing protein [Lachnospiraceae bacterium]
MKATIKHQTEAAKIAALEQAVLSDTPDEVSKVYQEFGEVVLTAHILGIACRFRGPDMVKVLVENGASFCCDKETVRYRSSELFGFTAYQLDFFLLFLFSDIDRICEAQLREYLRTLTDREGHLIKPIDEVQLLKGIAYLCDNAGKVCFRPGDLLYLTILAGEEKIAAALKDRGVSISDEKKKMLTEGKERDVWYIYTYYMERMDDKSFLRIMSELIHEIGGEKKLHFTDRIGYANRKRFLVPELLTFFMEHFDQSKMKKTQLMQNMILAEKTDCLKIAVEYGWLKAPRQRDAMIQFASENNKTECTAFLLEYKNRTADFAVEAEKAERKLMRELNADPDSMTQLRKTWAFQKKEDGTLMITGYKGDSTDIVVPGTIGKYKVTEIGTLAFAPYAPRIRLSARVHRQTIKKITLPGSIQVIGGSAFRDLMSLEEIVIAAGVEVIGEYAFSDCNLLKSVVIPEGVRIVGEGLFNSWHSWNHTGAALEYVVLPSTLDIFKNADSAKNAPELFYNCPKLTVRIPPLESARIYCEKYNLKYQYYDIEDR